MVELLKRFYCYTTNFINNILRRNKVILPTVDNQGQVVDNIKVPYVVKFTLNNETFFYVVINGIPHWIRHSNALEGWLLNSGVYIGQSVSPIDDLQPEKIEHIPTEYTDLNNIKYDSGTPKLD